ncbi:MAG TPA: DUF1549 domain-containing protein [Gemmataceae bacterium]|nr:DUF1549 domain-containing protein [Gemmataceae bacterium]
MIFPFLLAVSFSELGRSATNEARFTAAPVLAAKIDALMERHWRENNITPATSCDDAAFLRRITLDLAGRIPTAGEAKAFVSDPSPGKRARAIRRLIESPEFALHLGRVLDETIQEKYAGDAEFLEYLRASVAEHKPWDRMFREIVVGPWDTKERKRADRFLQKRLQNLDDLTNDTARVFFGVNVSCAKCHDHPLVADWKQDHYYGMASFFNRTQGKRGGEVQEKPDGDVQFVTTKGERKTAKVMFLSGRVMEADAKAGRRKQLVSVALEDKQFFSRAIVNRLWAYLLGRGLVQPVDQMHSANPPAIAGLLEWLADDLAANHYDLDRTIAGILSSRAYQLSSVSAGDDRGGDHFAAARLRPLTPQQYALSMVLATGDGRFDQTTAEARKKAYRDLDNQAGALTRLGLFDPRTDRFQSSATEALFLSNHAEAQRLVAKSGTNLVTRLAAMKDDREVVESAVWTVLSRPPDVEESTLLARWVAERGPDRAKACGQLVWALLTSAEFRFNH